VRQVEILPVLANSGLVERQQNVLVLFIYFCSHSLGGRGTAGGG
jgi:hypothetical protein